MRTAVACALALALAAPMVAEADDPNETNPRLYRVTEIQAREGTRTILTLHSELTDSDLRVSDRCPRRGTASRVCIARLSGPVTECYRVLVAPGGPGDRDLLALHARPCRAPATRKP